MGSTKRKPAEKANARTSKAVVRTATLSPAQRAHLVEVGGRYPTARLVSFADAVLPKVADHAAGFAKFGLDAAWVAKVEAAAASVSTNAEALASHQADTIPTAEAVDSALAAAKDWRRDAATALSLAGVKGGYQSTGASVPQLVASMRALLPLVVKPAVAAYGGGAAMKAAGEAAIAAVESARKAHTKAIAKLPQAVRDLHAAKGALVEDLNRLARAARTVAPEEALLFATSTHLRPKRAKGKKATGGARHPPATGGAATGGAATGTTSS